MSCGVTDQPGSQLKEYQTNTSYGPQGSTQGADPVSEFLHEQNDNTLRTASIMLPSLRLIRTMYVTKDQKQKILTQL